MASPFVQSLKSAASPTLRVSPYRVLGVSPSEIVSKRQKSPTLTKPHTCRNLSFTFDQPVLYTKQWDVGSACTNSISLKTKVVSDVIKLCKSGPDFINCCILGKGSFGTVVKGNYKGKEVAAKVIKKQSLNTASSISREKNALRLNHPNILKVLDILDEEDKPFAVVISELTEPMSLSSLLSQEIQLTESNQVSLLQAISQALNYCHSHRILHLDVKPSNILVTRENLHQAKLCDFGSSVDISRCILNFKDIFGTVKYAAPELLKGERPTEKCDVYSFGITVWQLLHRSPPFEGLSRFVVAYRVVNENIRPQVETSNSINSKLAKLYQQCWDPNPDIRPTMSQIVTLLNTFY